MKIKVLLVEDNAVLSETIGDHLSEAGFEVDYALDGITGLHFAVTESYDVLILDVMLPGMDGFSICKKVREEAKSDIPIIFLTARDEIDDKLNGFDIGADDYLVKPFNPDELTARLLSMVKRYRGEFINKQLKVQDLTFDLDTMQVTRQGQSLKVSPTGLHILKILMKQTPNVISKERLTELLWDDFSPESDVLRSHIYLLRKAVDKPFDTQLIKTIPGVGITIS